MIKVLTIRTYKYIHVFLLLFFCLFFIFCAGGGGWEGVMLELKSEQVTLKSFVEDGERVGREFSPPLRREES